jgi:hypothetical protein
MKKDKCSQGTKSLLHLSNAILWFSLEELKVRKFQKKNFLSSIPPKNKQKKFSISSLASKKLLNQKK